MKKIGELHWINNFSLLNFITFGLYFAILQYCTTIVLTDRKIHYSTGILSRSIIELDIERIETVQAKFSFIGMFLNYGTLIITGNGGTEIIIKDMTNPAAFIDVINSF